MATETGPLEAIQRLARRDGRYAPEAFLFVSEGVHRTAAWVKDGTLPPQPKGSRGEGEEFHVSGQELIAGLRRLAGEKWGMLAPRVLESWGVRAPADFGEIVFLMIEDETLQWRRRECDTREDFDDPTPLAESFRTLED
jgi:uncharacterized repeat protein (TIGR04138 family)